MADACSNSGAVLMSRLMSRGDDLPNSHQKSSLVVYSKSARRLGRLVSRSFLNFLNVWP